jgi:hypothetical protein
MHLWLSLFNGIPAVSAIAAAHCYVVVAIFMLLPVSGGMLGLRGCQWAATKPTGTGEPPALCSVTLVSNDWLHARLFVGPISLFICAIVGLCACLLTTEGAVTVPSKSTFSQVLLSTVAAASKSLRRSFCLLLGICVLVIAAKLQ